MSDTPDDSSSQNTAFRAVILLVYALSLITSCQPYPRDTHGTLTRILEQGELHIGVISHPPWTFVDPNDPDNPRGVEIALISEFAQELEVRPVWHVGTESRHFTSLENYDLDLVIGGIEEVNPWRPRLGLTLPYYLEKADVGSRSTAELPESLDGITVYYRYGSSYRNSLMDEGAVARPLDRLSPEHVPMAAPLWRLHDMNLVPHGTRLPATKRVMAVPPGEHALLMTLERFLLDHAKNDRVEALLNEYAGI